MEYPNFEAEVARNNLSTEDIAKIIKKSEKTVSSRRSGESDWRRSEMIALKRRLGGTLDYLFQAQRSEAEQ